jgi:hypothetical protein
MGQAKAPARNARPPAQRPQRSSLMIPPDRTAPEGISIRWACLALDPAIIIKTQVLRLARLKRPARPAPRNQMPLARRATPRNGPA